MRHAFEIIVHEAANTDDRVDTAQLEAESVLTMLGSLIEKRNKKIEEIFEVIDSENSQTTTESVKS